MMRQCCVIAHPRRSLIYNTTNEITPTVASSGGRVCFLLKPQVYHPVLKTKIFKGLSFFNRINPESFSPPGGMPGDPSCSLPVLECMRTGLFIIFTRSVRNNRSHFNTNPCKISCLAVCRTSISRVKDII